MSGPVCGAHSSGVFGMDFSDEKGAEVDGMVSSANGFEAHLLSHEGSAEEAEFALPFDVPARAHCAQDLTRFVMQRWQGSGQGSLGSCVA